MEQLKMKQQHTCAKCGNAILKKHIIHIDKRKNEHFDVIHEIFIGKYNEEFTEGIFPICKTCWLKNEKTCDEEYAYDPKNCELDDIAENEEYYRKKNKSTCDECNTEYSNEIKKCKLSGCEHICHNCMIGNVLDIDPMSKNQSSCRGCKKWFSRDGYKKTKHQIFYDYDENNERCRVCEGCYYSYYVDTTYDTDNW